MFKKARIKLTAWYLLIIMLVSLTFSTVIYRFLVAEVDRFDRLQRYRIERRLGGEVTPPPVPVFPLSDPDLVAEIRRRILFTLLVVNGGILVLSGGLGYVLAGRTLDPIARMVDEQNRFISDASHELRTPLTSLKSTMEVYLRGKRQTLSEARGLVSDSLTEVNRLQSLSDSLLTLMQFQKPNLRQRFSTVNTAEILDSAMKRIQPLAKKKGVTVSVHTGDFTFQGNPYGLEDLFVILLDNAVKYSPPKSTVTVTMERTDGHIQADVKDTGIGIPEDDMPHIFERFYRADSARINQGSGGFGLGLAIAKEIVDAHHGTISVESKKGKGTTFHIRLPVRQDGKFGASKIFS